MAVDWITIKQYGYSIDDYLYSMGYSSIGIYGMGKLGVRLYDELKDTKIKVLYGIDRKYKNIYSEVPVVSMNDASSDVDVVVITVVNEIDTIEKDLKEKGIMTISLKQIIGDILVRGNGNE